MESELKPTPQELEVLRILNGEDAPGWTWGAAMSECAQSLKGMGLAQGYYEISEAGKQYLANQRTTPANEQNERHIAALRARMEWLEEKYRDLIMQVATKWLNETRHETAKRYIQQAEELGGEQTSALSRNEPAPDVIELLREAKELLVLLVGDIRFLDNDNLSETSLTGIARAKELHPRIETALSSLSAMQKESDRE